MAQQCLKEINWGCIMNGVILGLIIVAGLIIFCLDKRGQKNQKNRNNTTPPVDKPKTPESPKQKSRGEELYQPSGNNLILLYSQWTPDPDREMAGSSTNVYFDKASGQFFSQRHHDDGASFHGSFSSLYHTMDMERGLAIAWKHCKSSVYQTICEVLKLKDKKAEDKLMGIIWEVGDEGGVHQVVTVNGSQYRFFEIADRMNGGEVEGEIPPEYLGDKDAILNYLHKKHSLWGYTPKETAEKAATAHDD